MATHNDTETLNKVEDFLINHVTDDPDEPIDGSDAVDMLLELVRIVKDRARY